jgi:pre-rRNA-processing protein TSR4
MGCSSEQSELKIADHTNHSSTGVDQQIRGALFKEYDLSVSQEELVPDSADAIESSTTIWEDAQTTGEKDEEDDLNLKQSDYDQALGNESRDPEYIKFLARVRRGGPDQILRYCRWDEKNGPLPISTIGKKNSFEPPLCEKCGSIRKFEFQVMPQLLYFLNVDGSTQVTDNDLNDVRRKVAMNAPPPEDLKTVFKNTNDEDIDWGTLDVYTCTASCELNNDGYCSEFVRCIEVPIKEKTK